MAACRAACADEFIERMPKGLDTDLGQGGVNVSGGQKQRLCIARALLKKPKVLIFDDSTSAVDTATEAKIRSALAQLRGVTKIIIAQRIQLRHGHGQDRHPRGRARPRSGHTRGAPCRRPHLPEIYASQMKGGDRHGNASAER